MAYIYSLADTWNASGTTFTGIGLNVTDTASAAGSLLMDLQVGGVSQFSVRKDGAISVKDAQFIGTGISMTGGSGVTGMALISTYTLGWVSSTTQSFTAPDLRLARDAANTLAQRNGVNAQAFNLYNTYTDASNYERGFMRWSSNALEIGTAGAGTGSVRDVRFVLGNALALSNTSGANNIAYVGSTNFGLASGIRLSWTSGTNAGSGTDTGIRRAGAAIVQVDNGQEPASGGAMQFLEQTAPAAPATNAVRIYAEDNGSGKTRLMALFPTGVAQQIAIEP